MNLIKKNIHMNREKATANTQIPLEEDINISDQKPDAKRIITKKGLIQIDDLQKATDRITVKGHLNYSVLYLPDEDSAKPCFMKGQIPFEEVLHMNGFGGTEDLRVHSYVEDLNVGLINSRKISVQALLQIILKAEEMYDEELVVDIETTTPVAVQKRNMDITGMVVNMKDLYRIREDVELPAGMPNIYDILWSDYGIFDLEWKVMEGQIGVSGQLQMFFLYEGDEQDSSIQYFECLRPFSGTLTIADCRENMVGDITYDVEHIVIEPKTDFDGEERIFSVDMALNVFVKILETKSVQVVDDLYGYREELQPIRKASLCKNLVGKNTVKKRLQDTVIVPKNYDPIRKVCYVDGTLLEEEHRLEENEVIITGAWKVSTLCISEGKDSGYACVEKVIPYEVRVPMAGCGAKDHAVVTVHMDKADATILKENEMEVKCVLKFDIMVFSGTGMNVLSEVNVLTLDPDTYNNAPGMAVYIAGKNDSLWNVGKQYRVPLEELRENNHLTSDNLEQGQKVLVVKTIA